MKRFVLLMLLALGCVSTVQAVPPCWPGSVVNIGPARYLTPTQLSNWWAANPVPANVANPHYYVAFHATDQACKATYGASSWAALTGPYPLTNTVNGTIWGGAYFQCKKCSGGVIGVPVDPLPADLVRGM